MIESPSEVSVYRVTPRGVVIAWKKSVTLELDGYRIFRRLSSVGLDNLIGTVSNALTYYTDGMYQDLRGRNYYLIQAYKGVEESNKTVPISFYETSGKGLGLTFNQFISLYNLQSIQGAPQRVVEIPTGELNGINKTFYTSSKFIAGTLVVVLSGVTYKSGVDFIEGGNYFTFIFQAPQADDILSVEYLREQIV